MPLYDFECPHGHRFERMCSIADRTVRVQCEGTVNDLVLDNALVEQLAGAEWFGKALPDGLSWINPGDGVVEYLVRKVPCRLQASLIIAHSNPGGMLDHGSANNRDAAREGRYDPANPSRRFMAKGRGWQR